MSEAKHYGPFSVMDVMAYLPHRQPFLFLDKVQEVIVPVEAGEMQQVGTKVVGFKNATINEPYYVGHFPGLPITPGVVQIETMAQLSSYALYPWVISGDKDMDRSKGFELRLAAVDKARFRKPVLPGDVMQITAEVIKFRAPIWGFQCKIEVVNQLVAECELMASVTFGPAKEKA